MKNYIRITYFGVLLWLVPFAVSVLVFPLKKCDRALFESIMPVVLTLCTVISLIAYLKKMQRDFVKQGILLGVAWMAISVILDLCLFMQGPMKMSLVDYLKDIGLAYLIIPTVCLGCGYLLEKTRRPTL